MSLFPVLETEADSGFRLSHLEVFNWGTFDKKIWRLPTGGETFLLTGANGSGKSTLVDAILTLLVPSHKRNYNLAAGTDNKKKDRSEKTYVEGHYGKETSTTPDRTIQVLKVRQKPEDCFSVLLGVFHQKERNEYVSIAQVFWSENGDIKKFFLLSNQNISIESSFIGKESIRELKAQLKKDGHSLFDQFKAYSAEFRHSVGLRSEKGIDLFNQIVAIKSLGHLNDFVREHMLESKDQRTKIEELDKNFFNLTTTYEEISKAKEQLKLLEPIQSKGMDWRRIGGQIAEVEMDLSLLHFYFQEREMEILGVEEKKILRDEEVEKEKLTNLEEEIIQLREEDRKLLNALESNDVQRRMDDLNSKKKHLEEERKRRSKKRKEYNALASELLMNPELNAEIFTGNFEEAESRLENSSSQRDVLRQELIQLTGEKFPNESRLAEIRKELDYLEKNKNLIPESQNRIRSEIAQETGIPEKDLDYACELIQVKDSEKPWRGALERLLRNFGLHLLVPDKHYHTISGYVNSHNLRGRLVYSRIISDIDNNSTPKSKDEVFYKLEFKPGISKDRKEWLESQILKDYNYSCVEYKDFLESDRAITKEGLIKSGKTRHEKNDRRDISDSRNYILGWNNLEKIQALQTEFVELGKVIYNLEERILRLNKEEDNINREFGILNKFLTFKFFQEVDTEELNPTIEEIVRQLASLAEESEDYIKLREQSLQVQTHLGKKVEEQTSLTKKLANLDYRKGEIQKRMKVLSEDIFEVPREELDSRRASIESLFTAKPTNKNELEPMQKNARNILNEKRSHLQQEKDKIQKDLVQRMARFTQTYPEDSTREELIADPEFLSSYSGFMQKIQEERLPEFQSRFRQMMDDKVSKQIIEFKASLEDEVDEIRERIDELNESLRFIDYQKDKTYIQLQYFDTKNKEIQGEGGFKQRLKECIPDLGDPESNEDRFVKIRQLLKDLKSDDGQTTDRWSRYVTDARNWLDFQVQEIEKDTGKIKEVYDSSAGKSGGQTVKLAYTILASAIFYQFGLRNRRSFRFVVIDEMFNNLDNQNAGFAMDLFRKLGLQLMVVTPMDKINVVEPYIKSVHFVQINPEGNRSSVHSITKEEIHEKRIIKN